MAKQRDTEKSATYAAEDRVKRWTTVDGPVRVFGSSWDVERVARFTDIPAIQTYVGQVLAHLLTVGDYTTRAAIPVTVRARRGPRWAMYWAGSHEIAIPEPDRWDWACNELTVLHEIAHHLTPGTGHSPAFRAALARLLEVTNHPVLGYMTRLAFLDAGLAVDDLP